MINAGHPVKAVWSYTPKQIDAYLFLAERRKKKEAAMALSIAASGARGDPRTVSKRVKEWSKGEPGA